MRRHRLAERLLTDVMKVPWSQVHEEAGRLEHAISPRLEAHLVALLGDPGTCPHGNPIPGSVNAVDVATQVPLASASSGTTIVVRRIDEELEAQFDRMQELETNGVMPGRMLRSSTTRRRRSSGSIRTARRSCSTVPYGQGLRHRRVTPGHRRLFFRAGIAGFRPKGSTAPVNGG